MPTFTPGEAEGDKFQVQSSGENPTHAVILVGGIHDTYHYWDSWKENLNGPDNVVIGYNHDHTKDTMPNSAHELAHLIDGLKEKGITEVTVVAHSMGGLVAKGALDELARDGQAADFKHIDLHTFGTPFGGFALAEPAHLMPGGAAISNAVGFPMGPDIGPGSPYMKSLAQDWPANMDFHMTVGSKDHVALPAASSTHERYNEIEAKAQSITVVEGYQHTDYRNAGASLLNAAKQEPVAGFDTLPMADRDSARGEQKSTFEAAKNESEKSAEPQARAQAKAEVVAEMSR
ncbi:alpha/beta hydrolase [Paraburkholderia sp. UCT31]|uniref:esterase/lipase family protein n=1 Tax=Paraburkholderia sp. UCT31 TaxID=2615209 RepID=UPI0016556AB9|nr:alpha/beta hydrolase [Paraburkholderia sp. UCT31]MBC8737142.1 alpha/beta hydrolase [Paraburkholderia sp. UCT31]